VPLALCSQSAPLILAAYFLGGMGIELFNIPWFTAIQNEVPRDLLGRVSSIDFLVSYGAAPLALAAMPAALALVGQQAGLIATGVIVLVLPVLALRVPGTADFREPASGPGRASTASPT
jgi:Na+/melibiose symporter-like transporter